MKLSYCVAALVVVTVIAGCGGSSDNSAPTPVPAESFMLKAFDIGSFTLEELPKTGVGGPYLVHLWQQFYATDWWPNTPGHTTPEYLGITLNDFRATTSDPKVLAPDQLRFQVFWPAKVGEAEIVGEYAHSPYRASARFVVIP